MAFANVGEAAHITAASPGPGARRYDPNLTPEQRAHIGNAIWLCVYHARLIDRDEVTYTVSALNEMKRAHEASMKLALQRLAPVSATPPSDLIAIGPEIVALGSQVGGGGAAWEVEIQHFVTGDLAALMRFSDEFSTLPSDHRYLLVNDLGDGRTLATAPTWTRSHSKVIVRCQVNPRFPRIRAQDLGQDLKLGPDHDLTPTMEMVSGIEAFPQRVMISLSSRKGEWFLDEGIGSRLSEYCSLFAGSPWLERLTKLEVIRLAAIPRLDRPLKREYTSLACVEKVQAFSFPSEPKMGEWNKVHVEFEVNGIGSWKHELEIFLPEEPVEPLFPSIDDLLT